MIVAKTSDTYVHTTMGQSKGTIDVPHNTGDIEAWISPRIGGISLQRYYGYTGQMVKTKNGRAMQNKDRTLILIQFNILPEDLDHLNRLFLHLVQRLRLVSYL